MAQQLDEAARLAGASDQPYVNRLILESSPYLRQHAHNPVDWYPWGDEALARAQALDRPILLSVGYSTCHWCHVMAHESFEDPQIAALINQGFVPVKVDREERPDIDEVYMAAVLAMNRGRGGWPMTLVLTPTGEPLFAATYLPARDGDRGSRRGLQYVLTQLSDDWRERRSELLAHAAQITEHLVRLAAPAPPGDVPGPEAIPGAIERLMEGYDPVYGGFGPAPRFPRPVLLELLLRSAQQPPRDAAITTLHAMARGGIQDQLGGGFHRYATDEQWRIPHFEKMLYDNAQLVSAATAAWQLTGDEQLAQLITQTIDYLLQELKLPGGAFASATDADSPAPDGHLEEGRFFTWIPAEVDAILDPESSALVQELYGITAVGPVEGRSVLYQARPPAPGEREALQRARHAMLQARSTRPAPQRDDKIVTAWNGYAISALARAAVARAEPRWAQAAVQTATAVLSGALGEDGRLRRLARQPGGSGGTAPLPDAVLEDEASLALACLDLFEATGDPAWIDQASARLQIVQRHFAAPGGGWFRTPDDGEALLVRSRPDHDGAEPSGTALVLEALLRLSHLTLDPQWQALADRGFAAHAHQLTERPTAVPAMIGALARRHAPAQELVIVWPPGADPAPLIDVVRSRWLPYTTRIMVEQSQLDAIAQRVPWIQGKLPQGEQPTAYVCEGGVCQRPTTDPGQLAALL